MLIYLLFLCRGLRYYSTHRGHQFCSSIYLPTASMRNRILKTINFNRMIIVSRIIKFFIYNTISAVLIWKKYLCIPFLGSLKGSQFLVLLLKIQQQKITAVVKAKMLHFSLYILEFVRWILFHRTEEIERNNVRILHWLINLH